MNDTLQRLTLQEQISIGSALRLAICDSWKYRKSSILRKAIKDRVALIRKFDSCRDVYIEPGLEAHKESTQHSSGWLDNKPHLRPAHDHDGWKS
jgi:hypothetical protein